MKYLSLALAAAAFALSVPAARCVNQLTISSVQGAPGRAVFIPIRSDSLAGVWTIDVSLRIPDLDILNFGDPRGPAAYPLHFDDSGSGLATRKAWPSVFYGGGYQGDALTWPLGTPGMLGIIDRRHLPYNSDTPEGVAYAIVRIGAHVPVGSSFPMTLEYTIRDRDRGELGSGMAPATISVVAPQPPPDGPWVLRVGKYRAAPGTRFRAYVQAGQSFAGYVLYYSFAVPAGVFQSDTGSYPPRDWLPGPPGMPTVYAGGGIGFSRQGDPRFGGTVILSATYQADLVHGLQTPPFPPVLSRYYLDVPDDATPGSVLPLNIEGFAVNSAFDTVTRLPVAGGQVTVDPAALNRPGDLNGDGKATIADAVAALRVAVGLDAPTPEQLDQWLQTADLAPRDVCADTYCDPTASLATLSRGDGEIKVADAVKVLRLAVGLPLDSPAEDAAAGPGGQG